MGLSNTVNQLFTAKFPALERLLFKYNSVYYAKIMTCLCIDYTMIKESNQ